MSEPAKKTVQKTTESFQPKKPEIIGMAEAAQNKIAEEEERPAEPAIISFQIRHEEFHFLGREYPIKKLDWGHFFEMGGYEKINPYQIKPCKHTTLWHNIKPEYTTYIIGKMVDGITEAPEGLTLIKFPAHEYIVVTHEWLPDDVHSDHLHRCMRHVDNLEAPDGYKKYDKSEGQLELIEITSHDPELGHRWEIWVPIAKVEEIK